MSKKETVIIAYKGFDKDMKCRGFQYEVGKEYEMDDNIVCCQKGFHACENPLDVLKYYDNIDGKYAIVEQSGVISRNDDEDSKIASSKIKIKAEIGFTGLFKAGVEWLKEITKHSTEHNDNGGDYAKIGSSGDYAKIGSSGYYAQIGSSGDYAKIGSSGDSAKIGSSGYYAQIGSSGYYAQIGSSGDYAQIGSSGDYAKIGSSGYYAQIGSSGDSAKINSTGEDSVICCSGNNSCVKAKVGSWITLSEWTYSDEKQRYIPKCVKTEYVDGEKIKADTWYILQDGEFKEVES